MKTFFMFLDPAQLLAQFVEIATTLIEYLGLATILVGIGPNLIRSISFMLDKLIIGLIDKFYEYFEILINGTLLTDSMVKGMMDRVYIIVGVFVVFRLAMLLINYIINPQEVLDEKLGVNALVTRVILGLILMIFMPNIFGYAFDLQGAIFEDKIIENIIMSEDEVKELEELEDEQGMGKIIGMTVFKGFFSLSNSGKYHFLAKQTYKQATDPKEVYDLALIDLLVMPGLLNSGINATMASNYVFDYFPIISTIALGFTLYILVKYCLDVVVRSFKLSILQVIAPIAIVEYMINKDRNEVFKSWRTATIACFVTLFIRVISLWFVAYVTMLMNKPDLIAGDSLLKENDFLLKAIILLGLLALMMELPKLFSNIFGLDLEQDSGVKSVLGKVISAGKMVGGAALMAGGAAIGGAVGRAKNAGDMHKAKQQINNNPNLNAAQKQAALTNLQAKNAQARNKARMGTLMGLGTAALSAAPGGNQIHSGFAGVSQGIKGDRAKQQAEDEKEQAAEERAQDIARQAAYRQQDAENRRQDILRDNVKSQVANNPGATAQEIIDSVLNTQISTKLNGMDLGVLTGTIRANLQTIQDSGLPTQQQDVVRNVQEVLGTRLGVSTEQTTQIVNQVLGDSATATPTQVEQIVNQVVQVARDTAAPEVTQVVNQVMGTVVSTTVNDATQTVNQQQGTTIDTSVTDATANVSFTSSELPESLFDGDTPIARRNSNGEVETVFDSQHMDG